MSELLIIADGMADLPGHETDIYMPVFHSMPYSTAIITEPRPDMVPSSERAIMYLLGYDTLNLAISRPRLEALALGLDINGQNVFRVNIICDDGRPADISTEAARRIAHQLGPQFHAMDRYRMLLTTPDSSPQLPPGLQLIDSCQHLDTVKPLSTPTCIIGATHLIEGIAMHTGATFIRPNGATGHIDTLFTAKKAAATEAIRQGFERVIVHIEAPDEAAHMRDPKLKADLLRQIDLDIIAPLLQLGVPTTVCADHITDAITGRHHRGPVAVRSTKP